MMTISLRDQYPIDHDSWEFCQYCKRTGHDYKSCKKLDQVMCFRCEQGDHFHGECVEAIRDGNPCLHLEPSTVEEAVVQRDAWNARCTIIYRLLKTNGQGHAAHTLLVARPKFDHTPTTLPEALQQRASWHTYCTAMFRVIEDLGLQRMLPSYVVSDADPRSRRIDEHSYQAVEDSANIDKLEIATELLDVGDIYESIEAIHRLEGESLYWRYTLATLLISKINLLFIDSEDGRITSRYDSLMIKEAANNLDEQFEGILREGQKRLPLHQARITLQINQVQHFYPRSATFLEAQKFDWKL